MLFQRTWIGPTTCFALSIVLSASAALYYRATHSQPANESSQGAAKTIDESESSMDWSIPIAGETLPSAYYLKDDVQYHPKGPEFKLWREAEGLKHARTATENATKQLDHLQSLYSDLQAVRPETFQQQLMILICLQQLESELTGNVPETIKFSVPRIVIQEEEEALTVGDIDQ